jgi:hypothetical protein
VPPVASMPAAPAIAVAPPRPVSPARPPAPLPPDPPRPPLLLLPPQAPIRIAATHDAALDLMARIVGEIGAVQVAGSSSNISALKVGCGTIRRAGPPHLNRHLCAPGKAWERRMETETFRGSPRDESPPGTGWQPTGTECCVVRG